MSVTVSNSTTFSKPFFTPKFQNSYLNVPGSFSSWGEKGSSSYGDYDPMGFFRTGTNIQNSASLSVGNEKIRHICLSVQPMRTVCCLTMNMRDITSLHVIPLSS